MRHRRDFRIFCFDHPDASRFNNIGLIGTRALDSFYHKALKYLKIAFFLLENVNILSSFTQGKNGRYHVTLLNL